MTLLADILLIIGALGAGAYCLVLSRRLKEFKNLEVGVGGAVAILSSQVSDLERTISRAADSAKTSEEKLAKLTTRAENISDKIELQMASLLDQNVEPQVPCNENPNTESGNPLFTRRIKEPAK